MRAWRPSRVAHVDGQSFRAGRTYVPIIISTASNGAGTAIGSGKLLPRLECNCQLCGCDAEREGERARVGRGDHNDASDPRARKHKEHVQSPTHKTVQPRAQRKQL